MQPDENALERLADRILRGEPPAADDVELRRVAEVFGLSSVPPAPPPRGAEPLPWEQLGGYRLLRKLGEGGMGWVFLAEQERLTRQVVLKVVRPELALSPLARERFRREAQAVARLRHPNIVTVFDAGEDRGVAYMVMELVPGKGLDEIVRAAAARGERLPLESALAWARDLARALACAHEAGIVHRDVKPSNVRIGDDGRAMLLDFGLARVADLAPLSVARDFRGTLHYASPEQVATDRAEIDARTDVYSLGVVLYECLAGRRPFEGETTQQVFHQILTRTPEPLSRSLPDIPPSVEAVVARALRKEPTRRHATARELADELDSILAARRGSTETRAPPRRIGRWLALAAALVGGLGLWKAFGSGPTSRAEPARAALSRESPRGAGAAAGWDPVPVRLFGSESREIGARLADWAPTEGEGTFGDDPDSGPPAVIGDCRTGRVARRYRLDGRECRLSGELSAMVVYDPASGTDAATHKAGLRLEWPDGRALELFLTPEGDGYRPLLHGLEGGERDGVRATSLGPASPVVVDEGNPLTFVIECTAGGTRVSYGPRADARGRVDVTLPESQPGRDVPPTELVLFVERGSARFRDFRLESRP